MATDLVLGCTMEGDNVGAVTMVQLSSHFLVALANCPCWSADTLKAAP